MYQSIDDELEEEGAADALSGALRWPVLLAVLAGAAIFAAVYATSPGPAAERGRILGPEPEVRAAYLRAIGEPDAALRRARLRDFLNQNPEDGRADAAKAQLFVLDRAEADAWQATVDAVYAPRATEDARRAAVTAFQEGWGRYLGGREAEVEALIAEIDGMPDMPDAPDRALPDGPSPFGDVPADRLAGGPVIITRPAPPIYVPPTPSPSQPAQAAEIVPARVRRNVTPRYPRNAQRRGVDGIVTLALNIDARGRVAMTEVISVEAERYGEDFVRAAERAAMRTRFHPRTIDGEPTEAVGVRKRYRFESSRRR